MTVAAYVGRHGEGKTYLMSQRMLDDQRAGALTVSNFGFVGSESVVTADDVMRIILRQVFSSPRRRLVIGIDEAGMLWDCRDSKAFPEPMRLLLNECRKLHIDLYFTVPDFDDVDVKLRRQCHQIIEVRSFLRKKVGVDEETGEVLRRPRLFRERVWDARKWGRPKERSDRSVWHVWDEGVAASFDTERLIITLGELLVAEAERLGYQVGDLSDYNVTVPVDAS